MFPGSKELPRGLSADTDFVWIGEHLAVAPVLLLQKGPGQQG